MTYCESKLDSLDLIEFVPGWYRISSRGLGEQDGSIDVHLPLPKSNAIDGGHRFSDALRRQDLNVTTEE
jgi:hypothetical protein